VRVVVDEPQRRPAPAAPPAELPRSSGGSASSQPEQLRRRQEETELPARNAEAADEPASSKSKTAGPPSSAPRPRLPYAGYATDRAAAQETPPHSEPEPAATKPPAQTGRQAGGEPCPLCRETARAAEEELSRAKERIERDAERRAVLRERELLLDLLDVVDNLDRAIESARAGDPAVLKGVELVRDAFLQKLGERGVCRESVPEGAEFDPKQHEALATAAVDDRALDGRITCVVRPGYRFRQELLRPAGVIVGKWARAA